ncbi:ATP-binding protein [Herbaspirillum lusitanum]|uniref:histidine kinase n=1 Tax=Herbaspirillum lusitanum TaxID=213312 RepID=A0ABW9ACQ3_9BURK
MPEGYNRAMSSSPPQAVSKSLRPSSQHHLLLRLFWMRCAAVLGQLLVISGARIWMHIDLPLPTLAGIVLLQVLVNGATWWRAQLSMPVREPELFAQLLIDLGLLSALLYFSGGATNPFVSFYLPALAVAAASLSWRYASALTVCALLAYSALVYVYEPLHIHDEMQAMAYHLVGMWVNFAVSALLITWFVTRIAATLRDRDQRLAQAREQHLQNQRIVALGTQAASAAHELNTPLATVAVIAGELRRDARNNPALAAYAEDLRLIEEQIAICKRALDGMGANKSDSSGLTARIWFRQFADGWRLRHPSVQIDVDLGVVLSRGPGADLVLEHDQELAQILVTLLDNAAQALQRRGSGALRLSLDIDIDKRSETHRRLKVDGAILRMQVSDEGDGVAADLLAQLGQGPVQGKSGGKGIGLMLAFSSVAQFGGKLLLDSSPQRGTRAQVLIPLAALTGAGAKAGHLNEPTLETTQT